MLAAAVALYAFVAMPYQQAARAADAEYRRLRDEQVEARARLTALEQRQAKARVVTAAAAKVGIGPEAVRQARLIMIRSLEGSPLSDVRLAVSAERQRGLATLHLSA